MKKLLFFALLLFAARNVHAQSAKVTIVNNTDFDVRVKMYGYANTTCPGACDGTYITNTIFIPTAWGMPGTPSTWGPQTPCGINTGVGWGFDACAPTNWCTLPSDFTWTLCEIDLPLAIGIGWIPGTIYLHPGQASCAPLSMGSYVGPFTFGPPSWNNIDFQWVGSPGPWEDATIKITQY